MTLSDLASLGSFVSGVAVLVSLVFLYFQLRHASHQIRQAEKNQQSTARLQRASINAAGNSNVSTNPSLVEALYKALSGAKDISSEQLLQVRVHYRAVYQNFQEAFLQHRDGLISDRDFSMIISGVELHFQRAAARLIWKQTRTQFAPDFVAFMDGILARKAVLPFVLDPAEWLSDLAREAVPVDEGAATVSSEPATALSKV